MIIHHFNHVHMAGILEGHRLTVRRFHEKGHAFSESPLQVVNAPSLNPPYSVIKPAAGSKVATPDT